MKTIYFDCGMGAAGDMLTAALLELLPDQDAFIEEMNSLGIPNVYISKETAIKCGIVGTHISVKVGSAEEEAEELHDHGHMHEIGQAHHHRGMHEIEHIIDNLKVSNKVKKDVLGVYSLIAKAESEVHGVPVTDIHFDEVGTMDAIADITAVCILMEKLAPQKIIASPIHVGIGHVKCSHGILPVPTPATAYILKDVPIYGGSVKDELCTPTGAALLKYFTGFFGDMPVIRTTAIGYGMGKKDFEAANCVRALLGETADEKDSVYELNCNVDDMTAEELAFAMDRLFDVGALEVFTVPAGMKKSRPGTLLHVLCSEKTHEVIVKAIFKHTTTIGIRENACKRYVLERTVTTVNTEYGEVRRKDSVGYGVTRSKYEYDDLAEIAIKNGLTINDVIRMVEKS